MSRVTKSYNYNAVCDICGFEFKADKLQKRWDGYMVCKEDWEPRNILDFYRTRDDNHKLPWVRPEDGEDLAWSTILTNITGSSDTTATYSLNGTTVQFLVQLRPVGGLPTSSVSGEFSLPFAAVADGTVRVTDSAGRFLGTGTITSGNTTGTLPNWAGNTSTINFSGRYGI